MSKRHYALLFGIVLSASLLAILVVRLDWEQFKQALHEVSAPWLMAGAGALTVSVALRSARWLVILKRPPPELSAVWHSTVVGYIGSLVYPGRAGEILRVAALSHILRVAPGEAMASAAADRIGDLIVLGLATTLVSTVVGTLPSSLVGAAVFVGVAPLAACIVFVEFGSCAAPWVGRMAGRLPRSWQARVPRWYGQAVEESRSLTPMILCGALLLSFAAAACDYAVAWCVIEAMGWDLPIIAAVIVTVLVTFGSLLPAAPGYFGIYQAAWVVGLHVFGTSESAAFAGAAILQIVVITAFCLMGVPTFLRYGKTLLALKSPALTESA